MKNIMSAAFYTISRQILLEKLYRYDVRGVGNEFIRSYFTDRKQFIFFSGNESEKLDQYLGMIQGSKTGPLYFDIYSNNLNHLLNAVECILYADDIVLTFNPLMPSGSFNICCPRDCVSRTANVELATIVANGH